MDEQELRKRVEAEAALIAEAYTVASPSWRVGDEIAVATDSDGRPITGTITGTDGNHLTIAVRLPLSDAIEIGFVRPSYDD